MIVKGIMLLILQFNCVCPNIFIYSIFQKCTHVSNLFANLPNVIYQRFRCICLTITLSINWYIDLDFLSYNQISKWVSLYNYATIRFPLTALNHMLILISHYILILNDIIYLTKFGQVIKNKNEE